MYYTLQQNVLYYFILLPTNWPQQSRHGKRLYRVSTCRVSPPRLPTTHITRENSDSSHRNIRYPCRPWPVAPLGNGPAVTQVLESRRSPKGTNLQHLGRVIDVWRDVFINWLKIVLYFVHTLVGSMSSLYG